MAGVLAYVLLVAGLLVACAGVALLAGLAVALIVAGVLTAVGGFLLLPTPTPPRARREVRG